MKEANLNEALDEFSDDVERVIIEYVRKYREKIKSRL